MDRLVYVEFGTKIVPLKVSTLQAWFPVWDASHGRIDATPLIEYVAQRIAGRIPGVNVYNSGQEVERDVYALFQELSTRNLGDFGEGSKKQRVAEIMRNCLTGEMYSQSQPSLPRSRSRFLILCLVASQTLSTRLAEALLQFYNTGVQHIVDSENSTALHEWGMALNELRDLISADALDRARRHATNSGNRMPNRYQRPDVHDPRAAGLMDFMYVRSQSSPVDEYYGRSGLGVPGHAGWSSRGLSLSPGLHPFKSRLNSDVPLYPCVVINTPARSSASMNEIERLRIRQAELAGEVNGMRRHIELMRGDWGDR
jgi:hypothetical protein